MAWFSVYYSRDPESVARELDISLQDAVLRVPMSKSILGDKFIEELTPEYFAQYYTKEPLFERREAAHIEHLYFELQGENWNGDGRHNGMLKAADVAHSSMSMGDVVHDFTTNRWFVCMAIGFQEIECPLTPDMIQGTRCRKCGEDFWTTDYMTGENCICCGESR